MVDALVGKYFFVFDRELDIVRAGRIKAAVGPDHYLVVPQGSGDGDEVDISFVMARETMVTKTIDKPWLNGEFWQFFDSAEDRDKWLEDMIAEDGEGDEGGDDDGEPGEAVKH